MLPRPLQSQVWWCYDRVYLNLWNVNTLLSLVNTDYVTSILCPCQVCWVWGRHPGQVYQRAGDNLAPGVLQVQGLRHSGEYWLVNTGLFYWIIDNRNANPRRARKSSSFRLRSSRCFLSDLGAYLSTLSLFFPFPSLSFGSCSALFLRTLSIYFVQ